jgi:hypothetical protein
LSGDTGRRTNCSVRSWGLRACDWRARKYFLSSFLGKDQISSSFNCSRNGMLIGRSKDVGEAFTGDVQILLLGDVSEGMELNVCFEVEVDVDVDVDVDEAIIPCTVTIVRE